MADKNVQLKDSSGNYIYPKTKAKLVEGMPTSLPANGGNSDTVDGKHASEFAASSHTHNYAGSSSAGGSATSANKLTTAKTIALGTGATGTATSFDGSANITIPVTSVKEAYLSWGGRNFASEYGPIDAAMVPELGANRLAFMPVAGVIIEYSRDGGSSWSAYSLPDSNKINLFNGVGTGIQIGASSATGIDKSAYMVRVTINTGAANVYTALNKFVIYCSTGGSSGCYCTIQGRLQSNYESGTETWTTFANKVGIGGWSGYNVINTSTIITYGNTKTSQYGQVRFTFGVTSHSSSIAYSGLNIYKILGFGGVGWTTPSTMAKTGNIYTYDAYQNVTFPAKVTATSFSGNATSATKLGSSTVGSSTKPIYLNSGSPTACSYTLEKSVPSDAVFTDTHYTSKNVIASSTTDKNNSTSDLANGSVILNHVESGMTLPQSSLPITGTGATTVTYDASENTLLINTPLGAATTTTAGVVRLGSDTNQTVAANDVTSTANRTYAVQMNGSKQLVVNVPWSDTNTTYSAATTSAAGLMSAADKTKLDEITASADTVSFSANATSGNKVGTITINGTATDMYSPTQTTVSGNAGSATKLATSRAIDGVSFNGSSNITHYGICSSLSATQEKTVSCTGFTLAAGSRIIVKFTITNTASSPTLNVNSTGAKSIYYRGYAISAGYLAANRTYEFVYNGTQYELVGDINTNTTYSRGTYSALGLIRPWYSHTAASTGPTATTDSTAITVNEKSSTAGRYYPIEMDSNGRAFVNVPWESAPVYYRHLISINDECSLTIVNMFSEEFTAESLMDWLANYGYNTTARMYPITGYNGGYLFTGIYYTAGVVVRARYDSSGPSVMPITISQFTDTVFSVFS